jgi:hypothetical protein
LRGSYARPFESGFDDAQTTLLVMFIGTGALSISCFGPSAAELADAGIQQRVFGFG